MIDQDLIIDEQPEKRMHRVGEAAISVRSDNPIGAMLAKVIDAGLTADNVGAMDKLCDLYERQQAQCAKREFAAAFAALQQDLRRNPIYATKAVPDRNGNTRYTYAPIEEIMRAVGQHLDRHGFAVTFDTRYTSETPQRLISSCTLIHAGGHERTTEFAVRLSAPPQCNDAQADGSSGSYAKRYALCNALGITIDHDDDARSEGDTITADEAAALEQRAKAAGVDIPKLLAFAASVDFASIKRARYNAILPELVKKEKSRSTVPEAYRKQIAAATTKQQRSAIRDEANRDTTLTPDQYHAIEDACR